MKRKFTFLIAAAFMLLTMMATTGTMWGQTTVTQTSFSAISGNVNNDSNVSYAAYKGEGTSNPAVNSNAIRLYQTSTGKTGGYVVIGVADGYQITSATIRSTMATTTGYLLTDTDPGSTTPAKSTFDVSDYSLSANTDYTVDELSTRYITFACFGTSSSSRLYLSKISITYESTSGGNTPSLSVNPASLNFGSKEINPDEPYTETFTVTYANLSENLTVSVGEGLTGISVSPQQISKDGDGSQVVTVSYNPTSEGEISGNITVSNTEDDLSKTVAVSGSSYDPANVVIYERYTGAIVEGDYIIYNTNGAMKNVISSNRFANESVTVTNNTITNPEASVVWHIAADGDYWTIYNAAVNKYAGGTTSKNQGALLDEVNDHARWIITYQYSNFTIENYGRSQDNSDPANRYLRQNTTASAGWATYGSGTGYVPTLYKKAGATTYSVTYNANGATSGTVPTDNTAYSSGDEVTVLGNTGNLAKAGYIWSGWNTQADGNGTTYQADATFEITASTTLYAMWTPKAITWLDYTGTPTATQYDGQAFNPAGLTVTATFNDDSNEDVTASVVWTPNPLTIETTSVTGTYMGQTVLVEGITVTYAPGTENNPYTVAQAIAATPASGTSANVYIHGIVSAFYGTSTSIMGDGTNYRYYISDDGTTTGQLLVYKGKGLNYVAFSSADDLHIGDIVTIYGGLTTYQNASEIASGNYLTSLERPAVDVEAPAFSVEAGGYATEQTVELTCATEGATIKYSYDNENWNDYSEALTINETKTVYAKAIKDANESSVSSATYYILSNDNNYTVTQALNFAEYPQNNVFVHGIVSTAPTSLLDGGLLTYYISVDGTENNRLQVYKGKNLDNIEFTAADNIQVGDVVTIFGNVKVYNNQKEFDQGNYLVTWERLETVATPTFTPAEGEYAETQSVTIDCTTEGATIYYTLDGTDPTTESTEYSGAIEVATTTTIKAIAAKDGMNNSAVATATYTINIPVLTASITVNPATVEATADGGDGTLTVTYDNITEVEAEVYFCDAEGEAATYGDWIQAEIDDNNNVYYIIGANDGEARTAYFKVYALDDNAEDVYSNLVTISQEEGTTPPTPGQYEWVATDLANLTADDVFVIVGDNGETYAMSNDNGTSSAPAAVEVTVEDEKLSGNIAENIQWNLSTSDDGYTFYPNGSTETWLYCTNTNNGVRVGTNTAKVFVIDGGYLKHVGTSRYVGIYNSSDWRCYTSYTTDNIKNQTFAFYKRVPVSTEPSITLSSYTITDVPAKPTTPSTTITETLTVTIANIENFDSNNLGADYCNADGSAISPKPDFIGFEFEENPSATDSYILTCTFGENNDPEARTAYFKVTYNEDEVVSQVVTATQLGYVAPTASITLDEYAINATADETQGSLTVILENMTISDVEQFSIDFFHQDGSDFEQGEEKPDWVNAEFTLIENVYSMNYTVGANTETTERNAYFKVYGLDDDGETEAYSDLVTVTQAAYVPPVVADNYELFSGDLEEGDYLIVYDGVAMNNTLSGKRFGYNEVTIDNNMISNSSNSIVWHIAPSETTGYWTLYNVEAEKYASNGGSSMDMSLSATSDNDNTLWSVTAPGETTHEFRNKSNESQSARYLRRNTTYGFACYSTSTGGALSLYKKVDNTPSISFNGSSANIGTYPTGEEITWGNIIVSQHNLTENISLSTDKGTVTPNSIDAGAEPTEVVWSYTPTIADYTTATITATSGTVEATFVIQFVAKTPHNINIASVENGTIAVVGGKETEIEGENVDFTVTPDEGYVIDEITVMAGENPVDYIQGEIFYRFQMPDSDVTISATFTETVTDDYELFSGDLVEGDYLIVYDGVAMNYTLSGKRFGYDEVTISNNTISNSSNSIVWHIAPSATEGYWTLFNVEEEKYASNGGTSMDMSLSTTSDNDNTLWSVTAPGETTHEFRNKSNESQSARYLRRNTTYGFACYSTSTGGALSLYKKVDNTPSISFNGSSANIGTYAEGEEITWDNIIVSQHNLTENISLSAKKGTVTPTSIDAGADPTEVVWSYTPTTAGYTVDTITATSGTVEATFLIQFVAKTPHKINIASVENGTIAVLGDKTTAIENENVDFTVTPDEYYELGIITITDGENNIEFNDYDTFYRFQMPDSEVTINATFNELPKYTITFRVNGLPDESLTIENIVLGNSTILPTTSDYTPAGFAISGWSEENSTIAVADPYYPTATVTLYAMLQLINPPTASGNYVKVTEELTDWSGEYLIVYEDGNVAFNGGLTTFDATENTVDVVISNSTIVANDDMNNAAFTIAPMTGGGYSIQGASGKYIGVDSYANGLTTNDDPVANAIGIDESGNALITINFTDGDMTLKYNNAINQLRFRYYKSGQQDIQLYKKETTSFNYVEILNNIEPEQTWTEPIPESTCLVVPENVVLTYSGPNPSVPEALVIQDGGQLIHENNVNATVQKSVAGASSWSSKGVDGWYLIASPVHGAPTSAVTIGQYDLFVYNEPTAYWWVASGHGINTFSHGQGFLYANSANVDLNFAGEMVGTETSVSVDLSYTGTLSDDVIGFNLVGNPFSRNLEDGDVMWNTETNIAYLTMNTARTDFVTVNIGERPIKPGEGFFFQADGEGQQLVFNPTTSKGGNGYIKIVAGNENGSDNAYINIANGNTIRKFNIDNGTKVYVMEDNGDDYAAARVEELAGSMLVNFKAAEDGEYTITVNAKNIEAHTMILFDDFTGETVDLLETPSYTFNASVNDSETRFKLIFDFNTYTGIGENYTNGNFAYQTGDEILVSGEGTLQVFDVMGRHVASFDVNGSKRISTSLFNTGVYIFKMNGEKNMTQKIVVR